MKVKPWNLVKAVTYSMVLLLLLANTTFAQDPGIEAREKGKEYLKNDMLDKAIREFSKAIKADRKKADFYTWRARAYLAKKSYSKAISDLTKAIKYKPDKTPLYILRGAAYHRRKKEKKAMDDYNKAIELDPDGASAYAGRAIIYFSIGEYEKSWEDVNKSEGLGAQTNKEFLRSLKEATGEAGRMLVEP